MGDPLRFRGGTIDPLFEWNRPGKSKGNSHWDGRKTGVTERVLGQIFEWHRLNSGAGRLRIWLGRCGVGMDGHSLVWVTRGQTGDF